MLDSVTASVDVFDTVRLCFTDDGFTDVRFSFVDGAAGAEVPEENSVTAAVRYLRGFLPDLGVRAFVRKGIPLAGGMGGSSADAAAVIVAAQRLLPALQHSNVAAGSVAVGSDVPLLCTGGGCRMSGVGDKVQAVPVPLLHLAVACGDGGVLSRDAYAQFDTLYPSRAYCPTDTEALLNALAQNDLRGIARQCGNALTEPAFRLCPSIRRTFSALRGTPALAVFLTGSGNCCCGLYESEGAARAAAEQLRAGGLRATYAPTCARGIECVQE